MVGLWSRKKSGFLARTHHRVTGRQKNNGRPGDAARWTGLDCYPALESGYRLVSHARLRLKKEASCNLDLVQRYPTSSVILFCFCSWYQPQSLW